jgi:hypothetical protein
MTGGVKIVGKVGGNSGSKIRFRHKFLAIFAGKSENKIKI